MKNLTSFLALPASLLMFACMCSAYPEEIDRSHNLPRGARDAVQAEIHMKRELDAARRMASEIPVGVKKMSEDPGEKFYLHYWDFEGQTEQSPDGGHDYHRGVDVRREEYTNTSRSSALFPPVVQHTNHERIRFSGLGGNIFGRDFQCPAGTSSCSSLGQSDLCCPNGQYCVSTSGGTGCCPNGAVCGGSVGSCDVSSGYTSCPSSNNGGCCLPGASCLGSGCVFYGTETVTTILPTATVTNGVSTVHPASTASTETGPSTPQVVVSGYTTTATVTISGEGITQTTTVVVPTTVVIPASSTTTAIPQSTSTTTVTPSAPVRPTTVQTSSGSSVSAANVPNTTVCPTGFYMCSAVYLGGCCRVDRDCHSTSCPPMDSTDIITSGVTIAVNTGASPASTGGSCPKSWYNCGASAGGGCCPSGYLCGASCTATVSGVNDTPKTALSSAARETIVMRFMVLSFTTVVGLMLL